MRKEGYEHEEKSESYRFLSDQSCTGSFADSLLRQLVLHSDGSSGSRGDSGSGESDGGSASVDIDRGSEFVTIATGPTSGIYYPIGGAFATALGNAGYKTSAQATGASVENINLITNDEAELAIAMQDSVMQAYEGIQPIQTSGR